MLLFVLFSSNVCYVVSLIAVVCVVFFSDRKGRLAHHFAMQVGRMGETPGFGPSRSLLAQG